MKRARHRWLGLSLFCVLMLVVSVEVPGARAVRATSLIFAKTSSTTSAPEDTSETEDDALTETTAEGSESDAQNATKKFSGIPQIDYIYDPNLPRELNGYNLSEYPFYEAVPPPETMDFKCDGLHDGFYASVPHKCQVYHHCLFGTRYDFLCANYTAFDQKTFICHFVSEVDCKNSPNYFSRNEALYKAASTAAPPPPPTTTTTTTTTTAPPRPQRPPRRRRPSYRYDYYDDEYSYPARDDYDYGYEERGGRTRRPQGRPVRPAKRRPYDDYDDKYEPRPRPRDESEDYAEERRPYDRRPGKRPYLERRPYEDDDRMTERRPNYKGGRRPARPRDTEEDLYKPADEDRPRTTPRDQKRNEYRPRDKTRPIDDSGDRTQGDESARDDLMSWEERPRSESRYRNEGRPRDDFKPRDEIKPTVDITSADEMPSGRGDTKTRDEKRPRDEILPRDEIRPREEIRPRDETRSRDESRPRDVRPRDDVRSREDKRPRDETRYRDDLRPRDERRPLREDTGNEDGKRDSVKPRDRYQPTEGRRLYNRDERPNRREERPAYLKPERNYENEDKVQEDKRQVPSAPEGQTLVKPNGHGIFSQPRMPPKIKRPVPANEKDKYDYVPIATTKPPPKIDDEYYDDYEEEVSKPSSSGKSSAIQQRPKPEPVAKEKFKPTRSYLTAPGNQKNQNPKRVEDYDDYEYEQPAKKPSSFYQRNRDERLAKPTTSEDDYYYEEEKRPSTEKTKLKEEDTVIKIKEVRPSNVRVVKRPFLPSRGGSPYLPRGLLPVAGKDLNVPPNTTPKPTTTTTTTTTTSTTTTTTTLPPPPTTIPTTTPKITTTDATTTTTEKVTTTLGTEKPIHEDNYKAEEEYEYYDEEDIEYEGHDKKQQEIKETTTSEVIITTPTTTTSTEATTPADKAKNLATKVLRVFNDNYEAIRNQLQSTLSPGDYLKPYLATSKPISDKVARYKPPALNPEISKPYTATGKPLRVPDDFSIKQNLADSLENDYDVALNEALASIPPKVRVPSGFVVSPERDYSFTRYRNNFNTEPAYAASELSTLQTRKRPQVQGVSIRTPTTFYLHPQRVSYQDDGLVRPPRQLVYRQHPTSSFF